MYLAYLLAFFLAFYLLYLRGFIAVEVRRGTLCSGAYGRGPAGNTFMRSLRGRYSGEHSDPELAVEVRQGTLWSGACCGGPAGNTLMQRLLAAGVRRGTLRSRACSWGQARSGGRRKEEGGRRKEEGGRRKEGGGQADIKSNNPHLTGREKNTKQIVEWKAGFYPIEWL